MTEPVRRSLRWHLAAGIVRSAMNLAIGRQWRGAQNLPASGFIAVTNHISELDPLAVGHAVYSAGYTPHFLAKDSLFRVPGLGAVARGLQQIPVARGDRTAANRSLEVAREVLAAGGVIIIYPEGTLSRDPEQWPMRCKTGAARLALSTGAPLVPITHWGVQDFLPPYAKLPKPLPRKKYRLTVGEAINLEDLRQKPLRRTVLTEATQRVEQALTQGVAQLRGEQPPQDIWDRALNQRVPRNQLKARQSKENGA
ncbi:1-acyl-sn-glycerol-3-phosphate acyltransferase [Nesterenkonia alkaliphila]|uniref:1-acyl-sn-glycerol-3-phosphate acyltransferase n=2 Tax=Nesterenkonia alkaliphila TaxID=1463631 RepID=A0A7K1UH39_9MICC|nr:lysophospholipid acyltransferase family protein [Nesterenkonia alkaliphila]MVT25778.1 1-acyl-sn-glycerol-3-phosphate acyltransferase [Nesterenkonia alkaliphila]